MGASVWGSPPSLVTSPYLGTQSFHKVNALPVCILFLFVFFSQLFILRIFKMCRKYLCTSVQIQHLLVIFHFLSVAEPVEYKREAPQSFTHKYPSRCLPRTSTVLSFTPYHASATNA